MRMIFSIIVVLVLALGLGYIIHQDPGYVLISYHHLSLETSLWVFIGGLIIISLILKILFSILRSVFSLNHHMQRWQSKRQLNRAMTLFNKGMQAYYDGYWHRAEQKLLKAAAHCTDPLSAYLFAAQAAQAQDKSHQACEHLRCALQNCPQQQHRVQLCQAKLQLMQNNLGDASDTLDAINNDHHSNPMYLMLRYQLADKQNNHQALYSLLPALKNANVLTSSRLNGLHKRCVLALLPTFTKSIDDLGAFYKQQPRKLQQDNDIILAYLQQFSQLSKEDGLALITKRLQKHWDPRLACVFTHTTTDNPARQLAQAETWLKAHAQDPELLLGLAHLCLQEQLPAQAHNYLQSALELKPSFNGYRLLAHYHCHLGETDAANQAFNEALKHLNNV